MRYQQNLRVSESAEPPDIHTVEGRERMVRESRETRTVAVFDLEMRCHELGVRTDNPPGKTHPDNFVRVHCADLHRLLDQLKDYHDTMLTLRATVDHLLSQQRPDEDSDED